MFFRNPLTMTFSYFWKGPQILIIKFLGFGGREGGSADPILQESAGFWALMFIVKNI